MRTTLTLALVISTTLVFAASAGAESVPARPIIGAVWDGADALSGSDEARINQAAATAPRGEILVATVHRRDAYGGGSIDSLARRWFDAWRIGDEGRRSSATGYGVLLLVAVDDREARIELGRGFSGSSERAARAVMDDVFIPRMRSGDVSGAIEAAVRALAQAQAGNSSRSSSGGGAASALERALPSGATSYSMMRGSLFTGGALIGVALIVLGVFVASARRWLIGAGLLLLFVTFFTKVVFVLLIIAVVIFGKSGRRRGRRGFSSSGRGFSSSRSGSSGRGATGRW